MPRASSVCSVPGCPTLVPASGQCPPCRTRSEQRRGSAARRGYGRTHRDRFRAAVLHRDRRCRACRTAPATVADHWPLSRRELVDRRMDPDDPAHGRGLCQGCDSAQTAQRQPGGWAAR